MTKERFIVIAWPADHEEDLAEHARDIQDSIDMLMMGGARVITAPAPEVVMACENTIPEHFGAQVLLIDHDVDLIADICSQTLVLDFGCRLALGPTRAVLDAAKVRRAYLGT